MLNNELNKIVSCYFKTMRKKNDITEKELARLLNISQQQVSRYENGKSQLTLTRLNQYLEIFGISWQSFINEITRIPGEKN